MVRKLDGEARIDNYIDISACGKQIYQKRQMLCVCAETAVFVHTFNPVRIDNYCFVRLQWRVFQLHTTSHGLGLDIFIIIIVFFNDLVKCCLTVSFIYLFIILLFKRSIKDVGWDPFLPEPLDHFRVKYWCLSVEGRGLKRATYETLSNDRRKQYQWWVIDWLFIKFENDPV